MVSVRPHDAAVELSARHAWRAGARFEVERESCNGDKRPVAAESRALDVVWKVLLGVQVLLEVVLILETPAALDAVVVHRVVMFLELLMVVK
jgi:hypothetical protein